MSDNKRRILAVDDDRTTLKLLKINLEDSGYEVETAEDGETALELIANKKYDLIILDIMLPKIDGFKICEKLRKKKATRLTPVIILSAKDKLLDKVTGTKLGADEYITKPFNVEEVLLRVDTLLKRSGQLLSANPLTELPGNVSIMQEVNGRLNHSEKFAFIYFDIDNFNLKNAGKSHFLQ